MYFSQTTRQVQIPADVLTDVIYWMQLIINLLKDTIIDYSEYRF